MATIVMTLLVRNEADVLDEQIRFHLRQGVDFIIATDNGSVDGTRAVLEKYEQAGRLLLIDEPGDDYSQSRWVSRMALIAYEQYSADWLIHADADEIWWPNVGTIRSTLEALPSSVEAVEIPRVNFVPRVGAQSRSPLEAMVFREVVSSDHPSGPLLPKVFHRGRPGVVVAQGNHAVLRPDMRTLRGADPLTIFHYPIRSFEQLEKKIRVGGAAVTGSRVLDRDMNLGWRALYGVQQRGGLRRYFDSCAYDDERVRRGVEEGSLVADTRLAQFIAARPSEDPPVESVSQPHRRERRVGAVIVASAGADLVAERIVAVRHEIEQDSVILVLNGPNDVDADATRMLADAGVRVMRNKQPLTVAASFNLGVAELGPAFDYYLLIADAVPRYGAIAAMVELLEARSDLGVTGPRLVDVNSCALQSWFRLPTVASTVVSAAILPNAWASALAKAPVERDLCLPGTAVLMSTRAFRQLGGYREEFDSGSAHLDLGYRLREVGLSCGACNTAVVCRLFEPRMTREQRRRRARMRWRVFRTHWSRAECGALAGLLPIVYLWNATYVLTRALFSPRTARRRLRLLMECWQDRPLPDLRLAAPADGSSEEPVRR